MSVTVLSDEKAARRWFRYNLRIAVGDDQVKEYLTEIIGEPAHDGHYVDAQGMNLKAFSYNLPNYIFDFSRHWYVFKGFARFKIEEQMILAKLGGCHLFK